MPPSVGRISSIRFGKSSMLVKLVSIGFDNKIGLEVPPGSRLHLADISPLIDIPLAGDGFHYPQVMSKRIANPVQM